MHLKRLIHDTCAWHDSAWCHQMETFSVLLALCAGNSPVTGEFPTKRLVTWSFDVFFDLRMNKRLCKKSWNWWFEMPSRPFWRHCNVPFYFAMLKLSFLVDLRDTFAPNLQKYFIVTSAIVWLTELVLITFRVTLLVLGNCTIVRNGNHNLPSYFTSTGAVVWLPGLVLIIFRVT